MTLSTRLLTAAATASLGLSLAVGTAPADAVGSAAGAGMPKAGDCHNLTKKQLDGKGDPSKVVPCSQVHTNYVVGVVQLPKRLTWQSPEKEVAYAAIKACEPATERVTGGTFELRSQSRYAGAYYYPTKAQMSAGARWIRCDVFLLRGDGPQPLPPLHGTFLKTGLAEKFRRCGDTTTSYKPCNQPHRYRAAGAFHVSPRKYPTQKQYAALVKQHCPSILHRRSYASTIRFEAEWLAGDRTITCYQVTP